MMCQYAEDLMPPCAPPSQVQPSQVLPVIPMHRPTEMVKPFEAKCVQQPETNGVTYFAKSNFVLIWKFQNSGETAWPLDTMFMQAHGDQDMGASPWSVGKSVKPGEEIDIFVEFNAPDKVGQF